MQEILSIVLLIGVWFLFKKVIFQYMGLPT